MARPDTVSFCRFLVLSFWEGQVGDFVAEYCGDTSLTYLLTRVGVGVTRISDSSRLRTTVPDYNYFNVHPIPSFPGTVVPTKPSRGFRRLLWSDVRDPRRGTEGGRARREDDMDLRPLPGPSAGGNPGEGRLTDHQGSLTVSAWEPRWGGSFSQTGSRTDGPLLSFFSTYSDHRTSRTGL